MDERWNGRTIRLASLAKCGRKFYIYQGTVEQIMKFIRYRGRNHRRPRWIEDSAKPAWIRKRRDWKQTY